MKPDTANALRQAQYTLMHLSQFGTSLKIQSYSKSGSCFRSHSPTDISTSSLRNLRHPRCSFRFHSELFDLCSVNIRPRCHGLTGAITTVRLFSNYVQHFLTRSSLNKVSSPHTLIEWRLIFARRYVLPIKNKSQCELFRRIKFLMSLHINLPPE